MFDIADVLSDSFLPSGAWGLVSGTLRVVVGPGVWCTMPDAWQLVSGGLCPVLGALCLVPDLHYNDS